MISLVSIKASLGAAVALLVRTIRSRTFLAFLAIDCVLILVHLSLALGIWETSNPAAIYLRLDKDRGLSEFFEYATLAAGLAATVLLIRRTGESAYWLIAAFFLFLLLDDSLGIHEYAGDIVHADDDIGEALFSLTAGTVFAAWGLYCLWRSTDQTRAVLIAVGMTVVFIACFGIGVDIIHGELVAPYTWLNGSVILLEDGNELIGLTLLAALMLTVLRSPQTHGSPSAEQQAS